MAENDIELSVGIKIDEAQFLNSYNSFINKTASETQKQVQSALDDTKGAAAKQWGPLPYTSMHNTTSGASAATKAFLPSFASDLAASGYTTDSLGYQSALINAAYRSSMTDPMQRYHRMLAMGLMQQADLTHPDTPLGRAIETDYALMSQPWSRDFIRVGQQEVLSADELGKMNLKALRAKASTMGLKGLSGKKKADVISAMVAKSQEPALGFDFAGMRDYAVGAGLGKWISEDGGNTADNFELINEELEKIEDKSDKTKKSFNSWHNTLKGVLGTLTAIAAVTVKAFEVAYKSSESHTIQAGGALDKRRAFIGMSALDELRTKVASRSIGLGDDAIKNEIYSMSENIEQYKLLGQGDALPSALLGIFNNLMSSDDPYNTYLKSADEIYNQVKGMGKDQRRQWLMLMNKAGLGSMADLVGQFISNPEYAQRYKTPSALFALESNPFYSVYGKAETMLPEISKLNESLKASYNTMYTTWEETFGLKFKTWWDDVMKEKVVPWFLKISGAVDEATSEENKAQNAFDKAWDKATKAQVKANAPSSIEDLNLATGAWSSAAAKAIAMDKREYWRGFNISSSDIKSSKAKAAVERLKGIYDPDAAGEFDYSPSDFLEGIATLADASQYKKGVLDPKNKNYNAATEAMYNRAVYLQDWLEKTGFNKQLDDGRNTTTSYALIKVLKEYLMTPGRTEANNTLESYLTAAYLMSPGWQQIIEPFLAQNAEYLRAHQDALQEVKITLFDAYGTRIGARVDEVVGGGVKFTAGDRQ